jgi:methanogenic corrinoid protein MtbC1
MGNRKQSATGLDERRYIKSQSELRTLKSRLPDRAVEQLAREVILRLADREQDLPVQSLHDEDIEELCHALLSKDDRAGAKYISDLRVDGAATEAVYLTYLAGAARMLGTWWETDKIPFTATALGTTRMYAIMRALRYEFPLTDDSTVRSAVFVAVPGETHVLGVRMAADLFRKDGWDIDLLVDQSHDELVANIKTSNTLLIGVSASGANAIEPLSKLVVALRVSNPKAHIIVSGNIVDAAKEAIDLLGADAVVNSVEDARQAMTALWDDATRAARDQT